VLQTLTGEPNQNWQRGRRPGCQRPQTSSNAVNFNYISFFDMAAQVPQLVMVLVKLPVLFRIFHEFQAIGTLKKSAAV